MIRDREAARVLRTLTSGRASYADGGANAYSPIREQSAVSKLEELVERYTVRALLAEANALTLQIDHDNVNGQLDLQKQVADRMAGVIAWFEERFNVTAPSTVPILTVGCRRCKRQVSQYYIGEHLAHHAADPQWNGSGDPVEANAQPWEPDSPGTPDEEEYDPAGE